MGIRKIIFRGKRKDNDEWIYGDLLTPTDIMDIYEISENTGMGDRYDIDPETIGQYTGLMDKNGKKIFEGDIVKFKEAEAFFDDQPLEEARNIDDSNIQKVEYKNGEFTPRPMRIDIGDYYYSFGNFDFEVIGNVYENPELLEDKK